MLAQNIINVFGYLLRNSPELSAENLDSIRNLCQGKNNFDEVVEAIEEWCNNKKVYDKLLKLDENDVLARGDFNCLDQPNATISQVQQFLIDNSLASLDRNEKQNDDPNKNDDSNQTNRGTKKS